jgi:senataxin
MCPSGFTNTVVLVGDPKQLPATIFSELSKSYQYNQSMFERFQKNDVEVVMLRTQYRMSPKIREFPSMFFYDGLLEDGPNVLDPQFDVEIRALDPRRFGNFMFYDVKSKEKRENYSYSNSEEARLCVEVFRELSVKIPHWENEMAILSPYKNQINLLRDLFEKGFGRSITQKLEINTVDSFQGREKNYILFSCVRSTDNRMKNTTTTTTTKKRTLPFVSCS